MECKPVEADGKHWVDVVIGSCKLPRKGPFKDASAAQTAADKILRDWTPNTPATMNDNTIILNGVATKIDSDLGRKFVVDACRAGESILSDESLCELYGLNPKNLEKLTENKTLIAAVRSEARRRISSGARTKEAATQRLTKAPAILDSLMSSDKIPVRGRVDSIRELRAISAGTGDESPAEAASLFQITFNLNTDGTDHVERLAKIVEPRPKQIEGEIDAEQ